MVQPDSLLNEHAHSIHHTHFSSDFIFGVSSSAPQTEGGIAPTLKGQSIWDEFSKPRHKKIAHGHTPFRGTDFFYRYTDDILLMQQAGIKNFRTSIAWSRILPSGDGYVNPNGIEYYKQVFSFCAKHNITVWLTLYHWDLPQALQKKGGWKNREIITWFENFVSICVQHFSPYVRHWMVLNEPIVFTGAGYYLGTHAPGKKGLSNFLPALHHAVLCQAAGARIIRKHQPQAIIGTTFSCSYITPRSMSKADQAAAKRIDTLLNRIFIEPALGLGYPHESLPLLKKIQPFIQPGDHEKMIFDFDFIGIQNYTREVATHRFYIPYLRANLVPASRRKVYHTSMNWEVYPESIYEMVKKFSQYKNVRKIIITENGASFHDHLQNGTITDIERINYLGSYLHQVHKAHQHFEKLKGYFIWSFTDNFEWAEGYTQRFGLVYVDFNTQQRIPKKSFHWFSHFLQAHKK